MTRIEAGVPGVLLVIWACGCGGSDDPGIVVTFPSSTVGAEAQVLALQLDRFMQEQPHIRVVQQSTPDAADQRHQLYVQWLNAGARDPDILQLDVIWTPEFAAAGWILPLDRFAPHLDDFFPATLEANRWKESLYALPWFVDVGMLYWRTDLVDRAPVTFEELARMVREARADPKNDIESGFVWQGARYEGLVTVFLEYLQGFDGRILDPDGRVVVDSPAAVRALRVMRDGLREGLVPRSVLAWHEEETRMSFQNGRVLFMRNWPYAYERMQNDPSSRVRGRFSVAPMPSGPHGSPGAALGGAQLAINTKSDHPEAAYAVVEFLTRPEQMLERARVAGQYPARRSLYGEELARAISIPVADALAIIEHAVARPVTPFYTELSQLLQVRLHRALVGEEEPEPALRDAAREMRALLVRMGGHGQTNHAR